MTQSQIIQLILSSAFAGAPAVHDLTSATGLTIGTHSIVVARKTAGGLLEIWIDGGGYTSQAEGAAQGAGDASYQFGADPYGASTVADYYAQLHYSRAITNTEINAVAHYLRAKCPSIAAWSDI